MLTNKIKNKTKVYIAKKALTIAEKMLKNLPEKSCALLNSSKTMKYIAGAYIDNLTGAKNRTYFNDHLPEILEKILEHSDRQISLIMLDIDHFKKINDTYGHEDGDKVLKTVVNVIKRNIRANDFLIRWGGEEFIIILPYTNLNETKKIAYKIKNNIEYTNIKKDKKTLSVTVSIGISNYINCSLENKPDKNKIINKLLKKADLALYRAKNTGRNKIVF